MVSHVIGGAIIFGILFVIAIIEFLLMKKVSAKQSQLAGGSLPMIMPGGGGPRPHPTCKEKLHGGRCAEWVYPQYHNSIEYILCIMRYKRAH